MSDGVLTAASSAVATFDLPDNGFRIQGGTTGGSGVIRNSNETSWTGGDFNGTFQNPVDAILSISGNAARYFIGRINNEGTVIDTMANELRFRGVTTTIDNRAGATYQKTAGQFRFYDGLGHKFLNAGTFLKTGSTTTNVNVLFSNSGIVEVQQGILAFNASYTQNSGETRLVGGTLSSNTTISILGGTVGGSGTITAPTVSNAGLLAPGLPTGTLIINGNYVQTGSGAYNTEVASMLPGESDLVQISGSATLAGSLNVIMLGGFVPAQGNLFQIMTYGSLSTDFHPDNVNGLTDVPGVTMQRNLYASDMEIEVTVGPINVAPDAVDDDITLDEDMQITFDVLVNDNDPDEPHEQLRILNVGTLTNGLGTLVDNGAGSFTFIPDPDANGIDSFTYEIGDLRGGTDSATVNITITPVNDAPIAAAFAPGRALSFDGVDDFVQVGPASELEAVTEISIEGWIFPTANVSGIIANKEGEYELARFPDGTIQWAFANTNPGWTWIDTGSIAPLNEWTHIAVTYASGLVQTYLNGELVHTFSGSGKLGDAHSAENDFRIGGRQLAAQFFEGFMDEVRIWNLRRSETEVRGSFQRALSGDQPGLVGYWRFEEGSGVSVFDRSNSANHGSLGDGNPDASPTFAVSSAPIFNAVTTDVNTDVMISLEGNDVENDPLTVTVTSVPAVGTLYNTPDGTARGNVISTINPQVTDSQKRVIFAPEPDASGVPYASFRFSANDGHLDSNEPVVVIDVVTDNAPPEPLGDETSTDEDTAVDVAVLDNDADPDGDTLTLTAFTQSTHGIVSGNGDGTLNFAPMENFNGNATFEYTVSDGQGGKATATVTISVAPVNDPPVAQDGSVNAIEATDVTIILAGTDIDGDPFGARVLSLPVSGTLFQTADGIARGDPIDTAHTEVTDSQRRVIYAPGSNLGFDNFDFLLNDGQVDSNTATVTVNLSPNIAPRVTASSILAGAVLAAGEVVFEAVFSEALATAGLTAFDVRLVNALTGTAIEADSFNYTAESFTLTVSYGHLLEGIYELTLISSSTGFRDFDGLLLDGDPGFPLPSGDGTAGGNFVVDFFVDAETQAFPLPVETVAPAGSLIYAGKSSALFHDAGDTDYFTVNLDSGQTATIILNSLDGQVQGRLGLSDPTLTTLGTADAVAIGDTVLLQTVSVASAGTYRIQAESLAGSGAYSIQLLLNSAKERESSGGSSNDTSAEAQAVDASTISLQGTADRLAVLGEIQDDDDIDFYKLDLSTGHGVTLALTSLNGGHADLELYDPSGVLVATGTEGGQNVSTYIYEFVPDGVGTYTVGASGDAGLHYSLIATLGAAFSLAPNFSRSDAQDISNSAQALGALASGGVGSAERFTFEVSEGDTLVITTETPGDGSAEPLNSLNPRLQLYDSQGQSVAATVNGVGDGRNAQLTYTVPVGVSGWYQIAIISESGSGAYIVTVEGATGAGDVRPAVVTTDPVAGQNFGTPPTHIELGFSESLHTDSVDVTDLVLDGGASVLGVELMNDRTVRFNVDVPAVEGAYHYSLAEGAFVDLQGLPSLPYEGNFAIDQTGPSVVAQMPVAQASAPLDAVTLSFNEKLNTDTVSIADIVSFSGPGAVDLLGRITDVNVDDKDLIIRFSDLILGGSYALVIGPDIEDSCANAMDQNGDGANGEAGDTYTASFEIRSPDLMVEAITLDPVATVFSDTVTVAWTVRNSGGDPAGIGWVDRVWLSTDSILDQSDTLLHEDTVSGPDLPLAPGIVYSKSASVTIPLTASSSAGTHYIIIQTDGGDDQFESDESNNSSAKPLDLTIPDLPDLIVTSLVLSPEDVVGNPARADVTWTVENQGEAAGPFDHWVDEIVFSANDIAGDDDDRVVGELTHSGALASETSYTETINVTLPNDLDGSFFLYGRTDVNGEVVEGTETNNTSALAPINVAVPFADLFVEVVIAPEEALSGSPMEVLWRVRNLGNSITNTGVWTDQLVLSTDEVLDAGDTSLSFVSQSAALAVNDTYSVETTVTLPEGISGPYYILVNTDLTNAVFEKNFEDNNVSASLNAITVTLRPTPDLKVTVVSPPVSGQPGQEVNVGWTVQNQGEVDVDQPWVDAVYLSSDGKLDGATLLSAVTRELSLPVDASTDYSASFIIPAVEDGDYRIIVVADAEDDVYEDAGESNNLLISVSFPVTRADLVPVIDNLPATATSGDVILLDYTVGNNGTAPVLNDWVDRVYLSADTLLDGGDTSLAEYVHAAPLAAGNSRSDTVSIEIPIEVSGEYFIIISADSEDSIEELADEANNQVAIAIDIELAPFADLEVLDVVVPQQVIGDPALLEVQWTVANAGNGRGRTDVWVDRVILSPVGNGDDVIVGEITHTVGLDQGETYSRSETFRLGPGLTGRFHLFVQADVLQDVFENDSESNNTAEAGNLVDVVPTPYADLVVSSVSADAQVNSGQALTIAWEVANQGIGLASQESWADQVYLTLRSNGSGIVRNLGSFTHVGPLAVGGSYTRTAEVALPVDMEGNFYVSVTTGAGVFEFVYGGNNTGVSEKVKVVLSPTPDLVVTDIVAPEDAVSGNKIDVSWSVINAGLGSAESIWQDRVFLQEVGKPNSVIVLGTFTYTDPVESGHSYLRHEQLSLPSRFQGVYQVGVTTNVTNALFEGAGSGNNRVLDDQTLTVSLPQRPDLQVQSVTSPAKAIAGGSTAMEFVIINQGPVPTTARWKDSVYLSLDNRIGGGDILLGRLDNGAALNPGESYRTELSNINIPRYFRGPVFLIVKTDSSNIVNEYPSDDNNTLAFEILVDILETPPSDLVTTEVVAPDSVIDASAISVDYTIENLGAGITNKDRWTTTVWLTRDKNKPAPMAIDAAGRAVKEDFLLGSYSDSGYLEVGDSLERTVSVRLPDLKAFFASLAEEGEEPQEFLGGDMFVTVWTDSLDVILEDSFDENINPDDPYQLDSNNYKSRPITILPRPEAQPSPDPVEPPPSDLIVSNVEATGGDQGGDHVSVTWTVENIAANSTRETNWFDVVLLTKSPSYESGDFFRELGRYAHTSGLNAGQTYTRTVSAHLSPDSDGTHIVVLTDASDREEDEINEDNNQMAVEKSVTPIPADLVVTDIITEPVNLSGEQTEISWTVQNVGERAVWQGTQYWHDQVYFSADPTFIPGRATGMGKLAFDHDVPLEPGESYTLTAQITLPRGIEGEYFVYVQTNLGGNTGQGGGSNDQRREGYHGAALESDVSNNISGASLDVTYYEPNLRVSDIELPVDPPSSGGLFTVSWTVENAGNRATRENGWIDRVYLSKDPSLDFADTFLGTHGIGPALPSGQTYTRSLDVRLPENIEGEFYVVVFTDSNIVRNKLKPLELDWERDFWGRKLPTRVPEFQFEGDNMTAAPLTVVLATPPDLQVELLEIPLQVTTGQAFDVRYRVTNNSTGFTPPSQGTWDDLVYLSRDEFLDLNADRFLTTLNHNKGLEPGASYDAVASVRAPTDLTGPFYIFVVTDPIKDSRHPRGKVFEGENERNNSAYSTEPLIINLPPPTDLIADVVTVSESGQSGGQVQVSWTVRNVHDEVPASGRWTDTVYLSEDSTWGIDDISLGRLTFSGTLQPNDTYTQVLDLTLPSVAPGSYRVIVRPDIFNEVNEGIFGSPGEDNNQTASTGTVDVTVEEIFIGIEKEFVLQAGGDRLFELVAGVDETLRITVEGQDGSAHGILISYAEVPTIFKSDHRSAGLARADQQAFIPSSQPGTYYVLIQGHSQPSGGGTVKLLVESLPLSIDDVQTDAGGDRAFVTTTILGARFHADAIVKFVMPGIAEFQPVSQLVVDSTKIIAIFDFSEAPRGLYDVKVINPDGEQAVVPYRYLVERFIEPDVNVGLGGPSVIHVGQKGTYGFSMVSRTNVDTPYVFFQFGIPEMGSNPAFFDLTYLVLETNLRGTPPAGASDVPWASIVSETTTTELNMAEGYVFDLATTSFFGRTFTAQVYPGFEESLDDDFTVLRELIYKMFPEYEKEGLLDSGPEALDEIFPGLYQLFTRSTDLSALLEDKKAEEVAFQFPIFATATVLTRDEFIAIQTEEALKLRDAIQADLNAPDSLKVLSANEEQWTTSYLAALEESGLLREEAGVPPVREQPLVVSLMATLSTGVLLGPAGEQIITSGSLLEFFENVRTWYGHDPSLQSRSVDLEDPVDPEDAFDPGAFDLGLSHPTHFEKFTISVPFKEMTWQLGPQAISPPDFERFFDEQGLLSGMATITGPVGFGESAVLPIGLPLPYTIGFENAASAESYVGEIRVITELDPDLDAHTFNLGGIQIGDIQVSIPSGRGFFQGDFDFAESKGFILRVSAGIDLNSNTATWLLQAIDPRTGEVVRLNAADPVGLLPPNDMTGAGSGFVSYTIEPKEDAHSGVEITAEARVLFNTTPPEDTGMITHTLDALAPETSLTAAPIVADSDDIFVEWTATDDPLGSGVKHVTVYLAVDNGHFEIILAHTTETSLVYNGEPGHTYEFLALATDNAGNQESPRSGAVVPVDDSGVNLGALPAIEESTPPDLGEAPAPSVEPSQNPLFLEAQRDLPSILPEGGAPEFQEVLDPFRAQAFATGIGQSHAGIGPMAIAVRPDDMVIVSGGSNRSQLFLFDVEGGEAGLPFAELPYPAFDLAFDTRGRLWAATGGGPLLQIDPETGEFLGAFGEGITQSVELDPVSGMLYVTSSSGIDIFDPDTLAFSPFSDVRAGSLAFDVNGLLWAALWPERGDIVRFNADREAELMLHFDTAVDSLAFGITDSGLDGLLFISNNSGPKGVDGSDLILVDLSTLQTVKLATGGSRGDIVVTTADGRVLISQSNQVDILNPAIAPRVLVVNPPDESTVPLPIGSLTITFDQAMSTGNPDAAESVNNLNNY